MQRKERIDGAVYERNYIYNFHYHLIWVTKYRNPAFTTPELVNEMKDILLQLAEMKEISIEEMEVMPDHVHLLIDCNPRYGIMQCVTDLKWGSAHVLNAEYPQLKKKLPSIWTRSCFVATVGSVSLETVKQYIASQKGK